MKTYLINLAKKNGFVSELQISDIISIIGKDKSDIRYYLWMCELQKWLREKHNIHIIIDINYSNKRWYYGLLNVKTSDFINITDMWFDTYEETLEKGLIESLKLIK